MKKLRYAKVTQVDQLRIELGGTLALEVSIDFDEAALEPFTEVSVEDDTPEDAKAEIDAIVDQHVPIQRIEVAEVSIDHSERDQIEHRILESERRAQIAATDGAKPSPPADEN